MATRIQFPGFVGSAFAPQSPNVDLQDLANWFVETSESPYAKAQPTTGVYPPMSVSLLPAPGFTPLLVLPKSPVRGLFAQNDRLFAVGGDSLYEVSRSWVATELPITALTTPAAPTITNSPLTPAINPPDTPLITQGGAVGAAAYGYKVTAINRLGETVGSVEGSTAVGNAALSATAYNVITWAAVTGATGYKVYRTSGTGSGKLIGVVPANTLFLLDTGTAGTVATPPVSNTTGGVAGATTYGYKIVATLGIGHTAASGEGLTFTGQATLSADDFNTITWPAVLNAHQYDVYRTTGGTATPPILIGSTAELTFDDTGQEGESATPPSADTTATFSLTDDGQPVTWASSGDAGQQILIGSGGIALVFDLETSTLGKVVDGATAVGYISTYFVVLDAATSTMKCSESLDGYAWDPLQIYQRQSAGDRWMAMGVTSNEIYLIGSQAADVWKVTGDADTRFAPFQDITIDQGIIATGSLQVSGGVLQWLGQNADGAGIFWRTTDGYREVQTSTRGIEREIATYDALADATSFSYQQDGHSFYVVTFPTDGKTWCYDRLTGDWHRRGFYDPNNMDFTAYRPQCHAFAFGGIGFGTHVVGDRQTGTIAEMSTTVATDIDGSIIRRVRQSPHVANELLNTTIWSLVIDLEVGLGTPTGQGTDPTVMLQVSKDGGKTWGNERWKTAGPIGTYSTRVKFNRFGAGRDWVFRLVVTDPIAWRIAGAYFEPDAGTS